MTGSDDWASRLRHWLSAVKRQTRDERTGKGVVKVPWDNNAVPSGVHLGSWSLPEKTEEASSSA